RSRASQPLFRGAAGGAAASARTIRSSIGNTPRCAASGSSRPAATRASYSAETLAMTAPCQRKDRPARAGPVISAKIAWDSAPAALEAAARIGAAAQPVLRHRGDLVHDLDALGQAARLGRVGGPADKG